MTDYSEMMRRLTDELSGRYGPPRAVFGVWMLLPPLPPPPTVTAVAVLSNGDRIILPLTCPG